MKNKFNKSIKKVWIISMAIGIFISILIILKFNNWMEAIFIGVSIFFIIGFTLEKFIKKRKNR